MNAEQIRDLAEFVEPTYEFTADVLRACAEVVEAVYERENEGYPSDDKRRNLAHALAKLEAIAP